MKNLLPFILIIIICSFVKKDTEVVTKTNELMEYFNEHKIRAQVKYELVINKDSTIIVTLKNY